MRPLLFLLSLLLVASAPAHAEDGYDLWLRYRPLAPELRDNYAPHATGVAIADGEDARVRSAARELGQALSGMLGRPVRGAGLAPGAILLGTPGASREIRALGLDLGGLGDEGYRILSIRIGGTPVTVVAANTGSGVLYGTFALIRRIQMHQPIDRLDIADAPRLKLRVLDHWDNLDRHVERGYAGQSLWDWQKLPGFKDPRYTDYARANASIGINGTVLTNVNANADILRPEWLAKVKALAEVFRPWGIRVYLTARFSAPIEIGGLGTADPLDPAVAAWWKARADAIYAAIPDFGGFLVKANSEGQPGPSDYGRTHAEGANMLADALRPHGGVLMWRAFVYAAENPDDRHKQAYAEFQPLDGRFRDNVLVQVKNGAIDFQPREPFHPLFGAMPRTPLMMEFQITKEYLGFATHLAYLGTMWEEVLEADTFRPKGTRVADVLETAIDAAAPTGMAGVANIGTDRNWSGSQFDQANWYAFGRFAWDPQAKAEPVAREWARMTWDNDPATVDAVVGMMMGSRQAVVDYMTPLGLGHLMATGHHHGPAPWVSDLARPEWNPVYYHRADAAGIGFDRTRTGSDAVSQYAPEVAGRFADVKQVPEEFLLWFHHLPWDFRVRSTGRGLWDELVARYDRGVDAVGRMQARWASLEGKVDERRWKEVKAFLEIQHQEAQWWRDASIAYFQSIAKRPLPEGHAPPPHDLDWYKAIDNRYAPGN
ncbi:MAG: alpha-glucuronidase family glycosyl hydrolase [Sphingomonas sp.]